MQKEDDTITIIEDELPNVYHIISLKVGELGIIFKPNEKNKFAFKQTDLNKYLKPFHLVNILYVLNSKNGVE